MEIIYKKNSELIPYINNSRTHSEEQINQICASINEFGFTNPLLIDEKNNIIAGHGRLIASKKIGMEEVPCIVLKGLTEAQKKAYVIADNKMALNAGWNEELLKLELENLKELDFSLDLTGFNIQELDEILGTNGEIEIVEDDYEVELPQEAKAKIGDIYQLGEHRLMCGDSTSKESVDKLMNGEKIKCLFTSPPYNMGANLYETYTDNLESKKYIDFNLDVVNNWTRYLKGYLFWNISYNKNSRWEFIEILYKITKETGLRFMELIVWDKGKGMPITSRDMLTRQYEDILMVGVEEEVSNDMELYYLGTTEKRGYFNKKKGKAITNYWKVTSTNTQLDNHKACFPVKLPSKAIELTTDEKEIVVDCFGGSGTTLIACEQTNRKCYMMEYDPKYVDIIIDRWEKFTGKKAVLLNETDNNSSN